MVKTQTEEVMLTQEVRDLLRAKAAEEEFRITLEVLRESFPDRQGIDVYLQEDPDEEGITRVILEVVLPESTPLETATRFRMAYYDALNQRLPQMEWPVCGLTVNYA